MRVLDPGHRYILDSIPSEGAEFPANDVHLHFVKRIGHGYPGNVGPGYAGPICQEVIRALIDRVKYLNGQRCDRTNLHVLEDLRSALRWLEHRAANERGDEDSAERVLEHADPESLPTCVSCGHVYCHRIHAP